VGIYYGTLGETKTRRDQKTECQGFTLKRTKEYRRRPRGKNRSSDMTKKLDETLKLYIRRKENLRGLTILRSSW